MINTRPLVTGDEDDTGDVETTGQLAAVATSVETVETEETEETPALSSTNYKPTIRNVAAHTPAADLVCPGHCRQCRQCHPA